MLTAAGEVKARGAYVIGIGPQPPRGVRRPPAGADHRPRLLPVGHAPRSQRLAYELALLRGTDPDKPRNLAKSVTVR